MVDTKKILELATAAGAASLAAASYSQYKKKKKKPIKNAFQIITGTALIKTQADLI